ncbi:phosphatidylserine decarboxylase [Phaeospirillum tilakii]|uniref:Phosphatidylserine decarboxylase n=1 Tax=Phaeospirillum tilakii TaxID=741673 RepID=A0ABW5CB37_9PROT
MSTQDLKTLAKHLSFPINRAGWPFIAIVAVIAYIIGHIWSLLGWLGFFATLWTVWFFRDPKRVTPTRDGLIVAAVDGTVGSIDQAVPPAELGLGGQALPRVTVLRGLGAVQIARAPFDATVTKAVLVEGKYHVTSLPEVEAENTRASVAFAGAGGKTVAVVTYAGAIGRDVALGLEEGQTVAAGERFGVLQFSIEPFKPILDRLIRRFKGEKIALCDKEGCKGPFCSLKGADFTTFTSHFVNRIDLYLPAGSVVQVAPGQSVVGGETVLTDLASSEPARPFETR